ncbi:MAG: hypothetical protein WBN40_13035 [Pseudomonadales bacterium]
MFELTDAAGAELHKSLAGTRMPGQDEKCFSIIPKDDKFLTLRLATPASSDATFEYDGAVVLALPKALRPFLDDKSLDIDQSGQLKLI